MCRLAIGVALCAGAAYAGPTAVDVGGWGKYFAFEYDYVLAESIGRARTQEPAEITLSVPAGKTDISADEIRVVRMESKSRGTLVPFQVLGEVIADHAPEENGETPASARSANVVFFVDCPASGAVTHKIFWGARGESTEVAGLPAAESIAEGLHIEGDAPGLTIRNAFYHVQLDPESGAILRARLAGRPESEDLFYHSVPIHFGVDVWSPPKNWDHDYDWKLPPNQKLEKGPLVTRYHRWGPLQHYRDVTVSITYTFYAVTPYIHVSSTMHFTADRSVRAVRMGEIVVAHSHKTLPNEKDADGESPDLLTHYAWPDDKGAAQVLEIDASRGADGAANLAGVVPGALGILDRDVPWVAGYHAAKNYGIATLRKSQFAGNTLGGPVPQSAPCTYVSNYGWGFTYWSRPMVYPPGAKGTPEDQNTALAAGTFFGVEETLLFFKPENGLRELRQAHELFVHPLRHAFVGTGPW
ncbi:MAG: hypothetical protein HUU46_02110 [Candidatus Hydrogenedentes bacterium]|nr:hypothetical protein [Candidatus Hydrogenedentota bacterium]